MAAVTAMCLVALVSSCVRAERDSSAAETSWSLTPTPLLTVGEVEGDPMYLLSRIAHVRLLPDARLVVADGASASVRIYRADGTFERALGGRGEGPGEIAYFSAVSVVPPDTVEIYDSSLLRVTRFLASGELVSTREVRATDGVPELYVGRYADGTRAFGWIHPGPRDPSLVTPDFMRVGRFQSDGLLATPLATFPGMRRLNGSPLPFSPFPLLAMLGDSVYLTDGMHGAIRVLGPDGANVRTIRADIEAWDPQDARRRLQDGLRDDERTLAPEALPGTPWADSIPTISEMLSGPSGRLWLKRYDPATDNILRARRRTGGTWVVIESDGHTVAVLDVPDDFRLMEVASDRVAGITRDALGVERVAVYGVVR